MTADNPAEFDEITDDISVVRFEDIPVLAVFAFLVVIVALQFLTSSTTASAGPKKWRATA